MKYLLLILTSILFISCSAGSKVIDSDKFYEVEIGMSIKELKEKLGDPYSVKSLGNGEVEYKYIERLYAADRVLQERHYLFILKNGKVVSKKVIDLNRPVYERNSYEMQTSQS